MACRLVFCEGEVEEGFVETSFLLPVIYNPQNEMLAVSKTKRILTQNEAYSKLQIFLINKSCIFQNKHDLFF